MAAKGADLARRDAVVALHGLAPDRLGGPGSNDGNGWGLPEDDRLGLRDGLAAATGAHDEGGQDVVGAPPSPVRRSRRSS
jgi:hypothetical protein